MYLNSSWTKTLFCRFDVSAKFVNFGRREEIHQCNGKFSKCGRSKANCNAWLGFKGRRNSCTYHYCRQQGNKNILKCVPKSYGTCSDTRCISVFRFFFWLRCHLTSRMLTLKPWPKNVSILQIDLCSEGPHRWPFNRTKKKSGNYHRVKCPNKLIMYGFL